MVMIDRWDFRDFNIGCVEARQTPVLAPEEMLGVETGQMFFVTTGAMSAVETGQISAVEIRQI